MRVTGLAGMMAAVCAVAGMTVSGCGGGTSSPTSPGTTSDPAAAARTITITSSGVSPNQLQVSPGTRVLFVNSDSRPHEMNSDPHPEHTNCPEMNSVGNIVPGQTKETGNLNTVRTCGFHDHSNPENTALQGRIVIQ